MRGYFRIKKFANLCTLQSDIAFPFQLLVSIELEKYTAVYSHEAMIPSSFVSFQGRLLDEQHQRSLFVSLDYWK
jgi:hypothetical protein